VWENVSEESEPHQAFTHPWVRELNLVYFILINLHNGINSLIVFRVKKFQCDCGKAFTSGFKLMEHNRVHTKEYPFQCIQCHRHFRTPSLLKAHIVRFLDKITLLDSDAFGIR